MKTYRYKDNIYNSLYDLSEAMGQDGTFIPRTISDTGLEQLGVNVAETEDPSENIRARKIFELKRQRDAAEVEEEAKKRDIDHPADLYYAINMLYSDLSNVLGNDPEKYIAVAKALYWDDPDMSEGKLFKQYVATI